MARDTPKIDYKYASKDSQFEFDQLCKQIKEIKLSVARSIIPSECYKQSGPTLRPLR